MTVENLVKFSPVFINLIISLVSILATLEISKHTTNTNRKLNEDNIKTNAENAGKNRIIYGVEVLNSGDIKNIQEKLDSGNYTVLNAYANPSSWGNTIIILGKIKL